MSMLQSHFFYLLYRRSFVQVRVWEPQAGSAPCWWVPCGRGSPEALSLPMGEEALPRKHSSWCLAELRNTFDEQQTSSRLEIGLEKQPLISFSSARWWPPLPVNHGQAVYVWHVETLAQQKKSRPINPPASTLACWHCGGLAGEML